MAATAFFFRLFIGTPAPKVFGLVQYSDYIGMPIAIGASKPAGRLPSTRTGKKKRTLEIKCPLK